MNFKTRLSVALAATAIAGLALASTVLAATNAPAIAGETVFGYTGGEQSYTVPGNVLLVGLDVAGASGGGGNVGAFLGGYLPVQGGQTLYAEVGQQGSFGGGATFGGGGAAGAWTCPGSCSANSPAGSGGGASDVRTCSELAAGCPGGGTSDDSRVLVAGGGGGTGGEGESPGFYCTQIPQDGRAFNQQNPLPTGEPAQGPLPIVTAEGIVIPGEPADFDYGGPIADVTSSTGGSTTPGSGGSLSGCSTLTAGFGPTTAGTGGSGPDGAPGAAVTGTSYGAPEGPSHYLPGAGGGGGGGYTGGGSGAAGYICLYLTGVNPPPCYDPSQGMSGGGGASFESDEIQAPYIEDGIPGPAGSVTIAPIVEIDTPTQGAVYASGSTVDASWACGGSGTPFQGTSCTGTVDSGSPIDTSPGTHTFTVTASAPPSSASVPVSVTYTVAAAPTSLAAAPQVVVFPPPAGVGLGKVSATLTSGGQPLNGQTITFTAGSHSLCTAQTAGSGVASCSLSLGKELEVLLGGGYTATFTATADYQGSTAKAAAIELGPRAPALAAATARHSGGVRLTGTLDHSGREYASVSGHASSGTEPLHVRRRGRLRAGHYTLTLSLNGAGHRRTVVRRAVALS